MHLKAVLATAAVTYIAGTAAQYHDSYSYSRLAARDPFGGSDVENGHWLSSRSLAEDDAADAVEALYRRRPTSKPSKGGALANLIASSAAATVPAQPLMHFDPVNPNAKNGAYDYTKVNPTEQAAAFRKEKGLKRRALGGQVEHLDALYRRGFVDALYASDLDFGL